ncbi:MAG TPA: hypothetical protein VFQ51_11675 [Vicinamibacteria bacterium]|nr:hypothetical protein [Vicinamibacteria bacterium]
MGSMRRAVSLLALVLSLAACEERNPVASSAVVSITVTPTPVPVRLACQEVVPGQPPPPNCFISLDPTITITETAGVGGHLESIEVAVRDLATGQNQTQLTLDRAWIVGQAGSDRVDPRGSIAFRPVVTNYPIPYGRPNLAVILTVRFVDDKGNVLLPSVQINVA